MRSRERKTVSFRFLWKVWINFSSVPGLLPNRWWLRFVCWHTPSSHTKQELEMSSRIQKKMKLKDEKLSLICKYILVPIWLVPFWHRRLLLILLNKRIHWMNWRSRKCFSCRASKHKISILSYLYPDSLEFLPKTKYVNPLRLLLILQKRTWIWLKSLLSFG